LCSQAFERQGIGQLLQVFGPSRSPPSGPSLMEVQETLKRARASAKISLEIDFNFFKECCRFFD